MLGMSFGGLLGGTMIVETVFSWNGIGSAAVAAISGRDYQLIQGYVCLLYTSIVCLEAFLLLCFAWLYWQYTQELVKWAVAENDI